MEPTIVKCFQFPSQPISHRIHPSSTYIASLLSDNSIFLLQPSSFYSFLYPLEKTQIYKKFFSTKTTAISDFDLHPVLMRMAVLREDESLEAYDFQGKSFNKKPCWSFSTKLSLKKISYDLFNYNKMIGRSVESMFHIDLVKESCDRILRSSKTAVKDLDPYKGLEAETLSLGASSQKGAKLNLKPGIKNNCALENLNRLRPSYLNKNVFNGFFDLNLNYFKPFISKHYGEPISIQQPSEHLVMFLESSREINILDRRTGEIVFKFFLPRAITSSFFSQPFLAESKKGAHIKASFNDLGEICVTWASSNFCVIDLKKGGISEYFEDPNHIFWESYWDSSKGCWIMQIDGGALVYYSKGMFEMFLNGPAGSQGVWIDGKESRGAFFDQYSIQFFEYN